MIFITKHISNHIIKYDQYFAVFIWIMFFNIFINIIHITRVFNKSLRILKCFKLVFWRLLTNNWYFVSYRFLANKKILSIYGWLLIIMIQFLWPIWIMFFYTFFYDSSKLIIFVLLYYIVRFIFFFFSF